MREDSSLTVSSDLVTPSGRAFLLKVLEEGPAVICLVDREGRFLYVNQRFTEVTGYHADEVIGEHTRLLKSGKQSASEYRGMWECVLSGSDWTGEFHNRKKNGELYWERATISPMCTELGEVDSFIKVSVEINDQKQAEQELICSRDELRSREALLEESLEKMGRMTHELQEVQACYERLVQATNGFVYSVTLKDGEVVHTLNYPGCELVTGYTAEEYDQDEELWWRMIHPDDVQKVTRYFQDLKGGAPSVVVEHRITHRDGGLRWLRNTSVVRRNKQGLLTGYEGLITDITAFKEADKDREVLTGQLREMALHDTLTGLMNRRGFEEEFQRLWNKALQKPFPMGMLVIDVDRFKTLNDSYGHLVGDEVLAESARLVLASVRASDVVCRFGGDEMTVILPGSVPSNTRRVAKRILKAFQEHVFCKGKHEFHVTASIGAANLTPTEDLTPGAFLTRADKALYRAKQSGRNRVSEWENLGESSQGPEVAYAEAPPAYLPSQGRILIIDDDETIQKVLHQLLIQSGFDVLDAVSADLALDLIEKRRGEIDVALVDLNLGMESGLELIRQVHEKDDTVIPIVITGQASVESAVASLRSGAYDFLPKPFDATQVIVALQRAVNYRRLLIENRQYQSHLENMVQEKSAAHTHTLSRLRSSFQSALETMAGMLDAWEFNTGKHSKRVARLSCLLAEKLQMLPEEIEALEAGALLHDIGKIAIPKSILMKTGPLTEEEQLMMQKHPQIGYDMIRANPDLKEASNVVLYHHERINGKGYPFGLHKEQIPFSARIFSVIDAYDAMRAERSYSKSLPAAISLAEIVRHRGTQFDPVVVDALVACQEEIELVGDWASDLPRKKG